MPLVPSDAFPFCGPSNLGPAAVIDSQRSINLYPEPGLPSSKTRMGLVGRPGLSQLTALGPGTGYGHSLWAGNGRLFAATGTHVYEVNSVGGVITDYGAGLGNTYAYPTPMIANGTQLLINDPITGQVFNVNPAGPALNLVFNGVALEYLDGFYISIATGASLAGTNPNQINVSANGDGTSWPALSYAIRTGSADLTIGLAVLNSLLYIFGQKSIEVWYDAGNAIFPFARVNGGTINLGCMSAQTIVKFSNTILWLGADQTGFGQVYMMNGMSPVKVSTPAIEYLVCNTGAQYRLTGAKAYGYQEAGHTFYVLQLRTNFATQPTTLTLVYDLTTGLWHERTYASTSYGKPLNPTAFANVPGFASLNQQYVLDEEKGYLWNQSVTYTNDGGSGNSITYTRTAPHSSAQNQWTKYPRFELDCQIGTAAPTLDWSNDGGQNFLGKTVALRQAADAGAAQTFRRFYATELGRSRDRVFKVTITDDANTIRIANAYLTANPGTS
jgi:hypothetical protein